jgi:transcriptional regulator with GAF, ATPase, and Fis domain
MQASVMVSKSPDITVLLMEESATGKERITKAIHDNSSRKNNRMMVFNYTATEQDLI